MKIEKPKLLKSYECWIERGDGNKFVTTHIGTSASQARYQFYIELDCSESYSRMFRLIRSKCIGTMKIENHFGNPDTFERMINSRNIPFARLGMVIDVDGKKGWIVGSNSSMNLDVIFEGTTYSSNCHPTWQTTYYNSDGTIVKNFKEPKKEYKIQVLDPNYDYPF